MLVAVRLPVPQAAAVIKAAWEAGTAVAPLDPGAPPAERDRALAAIRPTSVVDEDRERPWLGGVDAPADVAAVVTTSGTTGEPRAVELTWRGLRASAAAVHDALGAGPGDRWLCCLPLHHVAGLAVVGRAWAAGVPVTFDPSDSGATLVSLVPTQVRRGTLDLARFRCILVGGAPVPDDIRSRPGVVTTYGLTETWGGVVHDGRPLNGVELTLAADGEVLVRTPTVMRGYRLDDAATADAFTGEGFLRTGDVGRWEPDGRLRVVDRLRDLMVTGGVKVSPAEVESVLTTHPDVADVAVAGVPDEEWGERVVAYVVPTDHTRPPSLQALRAYARDRLAAAKLPREVVLVDAIPRSPGGKLMRRLLRPTGGLEVQ